MSWYKTAKYDGRKGPKFKTLEKNKKPLTDEERKEVMDADAVWHGNFDGDIKPTPAVWKAEVNGKMWFVTNTHRAYNVMPTLKGAIRQYHDFIKGTA